MLNLLAIGDPIIDTHVQIDDQCSECHLTGDREHLCFKYGEKIPIIDSFQSLGGNAPNVAVGAARLGLSSAILSTIGTDAYGRLALQDLKKLGVDTSLVATDREHKTRYSIVLNYKGERTILSYSEEKNYHWPKKIPVSDWIYYTGLSKGFETIQKKLIEYLTKHPTVRLAVNPGSYLLKYAKSSLLEMLPRADLLIVNMEEAEKIANTTLAKEKSVSTLLHKLFALEVKEVALTDGPRGAWAGDADTIWSMPTYPAKVVAKTGAGDAFSSGYLAARFYNHDIPKALQWGQANSAGVIQAHGPHGGLLKKSRIQEYIERFSNIKAKIV